MAVRQRVLAIAFVLLAVQCNAGQSGEKLVISNSTNQVIVAFARPQNLRARTAGWPIKVEIFPYESEALVLPGNGQYDIAIRQEDGTTYVLRQVYLTRRIGDCPNSQPAEPKMLASGWRIVTDPATGVKINRRDPTLDTTFQTSIAYDTVRVDFDPISHDPGRKPRKPKKPEQPEK